MTNIGSAAFYGTDWYNNHSDGIMYLNNWVVGYKGNMRNNTSITIKEGTIGIANDVFMNKSELSNLEIPNSVTSIGNQAFRDCSGLTSVTIGNSVASIGIYAFSGCSCLTSVTIPNSVTSIEQSAFEDCDSITRIDCQAETPPTAYANTFSNKIYTKATLNVLEGCVEAYKSADVWKEFTNISVLGASTGIKQIESAAASSYIYDINGNRIGKNCDDINNLKRGIYIIGGKKVYIR